MLDLRGHQSTVIANALSLGTIANNSNATTTGSTTGTLDFDTGTFTANSVNIVGSKSSGTAGTGLGAGIINLSGGSFTENTGGSLTLSATNTAATGTSDAAF